jgi:hypothetical protein
MNTYFSTFGLTHLQDESVTHPLTRLDVRLPLSLLLAGACLRRHFVATTPPDAPSGASSHGF